MANEDDSLAGEQADQRCDDPVAEPKGWVPPLEHENAGILALLGFVALVQVGFVALFLRFRNRAKKLAERRESLHLIRGGAP